MIQSLKLQEFALESHMRLAYGWNRIPESWSSVAPIAHMASCPMPQVGSLPKGTDLISHFLPTFGSIHRTKAVQGAERSPESKACLSSRLIPWTHTPPPLSCSAARIQPHKTPEGRKRAAWRTPGRRKAGPAEEEVKLPTAPPESSAGRQGGGGGSWEYSHT